MAHNLLLTDIPINVFSCEYWPGCRRMMPKPRFDIFHLSTIEPTLVYWFYRIKGVSTVCMLVFYIGSDVRVCAKARQI